MCEKASCGVVQGSQECDFVGLYCNSNGNTSRSHDCTRQTILTHTNISECDTLTRHPDGPCPPLDGTGYQCCWHNSHESRPASRYDHDCRFCAGDDRLRPDRTRGTSVGG